MKLSIRISMNDHGGYTADCPALPGCTIRGNSKAEVREKLDDAIRGYMAALNNFVPERLIQQVVET
jgi:predicted RNase H-like HicB family nuclease